MMNTINRGMQTQVIQFVVKDGESDSDPLSGKESEAEIEDDRSKVQIRPLKIPSPVVGQFSPPDLPPEKVRVVFESGEIFACPWVFSPFFLKRCLYVFPVLFHPSLETSSKGLPTEPVPRLHNAKG